MAFTGELCDDSELVQKLRKEIEALRKQCDVCNKTNSEYFFWLSPNLVEGRLLKWLRFFVETPGQKIQAGSAKFNRSSKVKLILW